MEIELLSMTFNNFKGIKHFTIDFNPLTNIYGKNGIGKTTIFDGFRWLFFGKDSFDRKDFNIKNTIALVLNRQDHEVSSIALIDGVKTEFKRILREKWVKKRGELDAEFSGHETLFFINDVPFQQGEYSKKIDDILNESIFKLITDPQYFNRLKWQERRSILMDMAGDITHSEILDKIARIDNKYEIGSLSNVLNSGKSAEEYKREISSKKKIINDNLKSIPTRIDELLRGLPEEPNYDIINTEIEGLNAQILNIDGSINNLVLAYDDEYKKIQGTQAEIHRLTTKRNDINYAERSAIQSQESASRFKRQVLTDNIETINSGIKSKTALVNSKKEIQKGLKLRTDNLRALWVSTNEKELVFNQHEFMCPTCERAFEDEDIEAKKAEMLNNFNAEKTKSLAKINVDGKALVKEVSDNDELILSLEAALFQLDINLTEAGSELVKFENSAKEPIQSIDDILANNDEYVSIGSKIAALQSKIQEVPKIDTSDLKAQKSEINIKLDALKKQLNIKDQIEKSNARKEELENEERTLAQQLANLEQIEYTINEFDRSKIDLMESRINGKFKHVKFKMFDRQINGGEAETCETLVDGVPYSDANNAGRINSGLDIINALCAHYNAFAPVFIDNKESVTNIIPVKSQIINLIVSEDDKQLRVG